MDSKIKVSLHAFINIVGNLLVVGLIPPEYKLYVLMAFNTVQVIYAYFDPTYVFQQLGKKLGHTYTKADL
jgi:hypothetical protein